MNKNQKNMEEDFLKKLLVKGYILLPKATPITRVCLIRMPGRVYSSPSQREPKRGVRSSMTSENTTT